MSNGLCDIYGHPASVRVKMTENGFRKVKEICDEHYAEISVQAPLAGKLLSQEFKPGDKVTIGYDDQSKTVTFKISEQKTRRAPS